LQNEPELRQIYMGNDRMSLVLRWLTLQIAQYEGTSLDNVSSRTCSLGYGKEKEQESDHGPDHIVRTYGALITKASRSLPPKSIRVSDPVTEIHYEDAGDRCVVICRSGTVLRPKRVVVTVPLGVLKANMIKFSPPLPKLKQEAIGRLGFGLMNKLLIHFEDCFWDPDCHSFGIASPSEEFPYWLNHLPVCGRPVLVSLYSGAFALRLQQEQWSDEKIVASACQLLRDSFGLEELPPIIDTHVTHWEKEEYIRGSYSYSHHSSFNDDVETVARPIDNRIFFAGEHTSVDEGGYVHGALNTGVAAADQVLASLTSSRL